MFFIAPLPTGLDHGGEKTITLCWSGWHTTLLGSMSSGVNWMTKSKDIIWLQVAIVQYMKSCVDVHWIKSCSTKNKFTNYNFNYNLGNGVHRPQGEWIFLHKISLKNGMKTPGHWDTCHTHKPQPWCCFLGSGNSFLLPIGWLVCPCTQEWMSFTDNAHVALCIELWHHDMMTHGVPSLCILKTFQSTGTCMPL